MNTRIEDIPKAEMRRYSYFIDTIFTLFLFDMIFPFFDTNSST